MSITFRYVHLRRPDNSLQKAPWIPIYLHEKEGKLVRWFALVDSGADTSVMPKEVAQLLGLEETDSEIETGGIGGKTKVKESKLTFTVKDSREKHQMTIPVLVLQDPKSKVPLLLGRNGFFEKFHISFKQDEEKIVLKKVQPRMKRH